MDKGISRDFFVKGNPPVWLRGENKNILSTSVCLNRNLKGFKFPNKATIEEKRQTCSRILGKIHHSAMSSGLRTDSFSNIDNEVKNLLLERKLTSACIRHKDPDNDTRAILVNEDESIVIVINDVDHLHIKASCAGFDLEKCYQMCEDVLRQISLDFACDSTFGYLTSMPAIMNTGIQVEVTAHLPGILMYEENDFYIDELRSEGILVDGLLGPGLPPHGSMFTLFNQNTRRKDIPETLSHFKEVVENVVKKDKILREEVSLIERKDFIGRSYGTLKYAEKIDFDETMAALSSLRAGLEDNEFNKIDFHTLNKLTWYIFPTQILNLLNCPADEVDFVRSKIIKQALSKEKK